MEIQNPRPVWDIVGCYKMSSDEKKGSSRCNWLRKIGLLVFFFIFFLRCCLDSMASIWWSGELDQLQVCGDIKRKAGRRTCCGPLAAHKWIWWRDRTEGRQKSWEIQ